MDHPFSPATLAHLLPSACEYNEQGECFLSEISEHFVHAMYTMSRLVTYVEWHGSEEFPDLMHHLIDSRQKVVTTLRLDLHLSKTEEHNLTAHLRDCISQELMADLYMTPEEEVARLHKLPYLKQIAGTYTELLTETKRIGLLPGQSSKTTTFLKAYAALAPKGVIGQTQLWIMKTTMKCLEAGVPFFELEQLEPLFSPPPEAFRLSPDAAAILADLQTTGKKIRTSFAQVKNSALYQMQYTQVERILTYMQVLEGYVHTLGAYDHLLP